MPTFKLIPHPYFPPRQADIALTVDVERSGGALNLWYWLAGGGDGILLPDYGDNWRGRTNGLWNHTCFEAFVRVGDGAGYSELNFAPFGEWAAYAFDDVRIGMRDLVGTSEPLAGAGYKGPRENGDYGRSYETIDVFDPASDWHLNLSAVIEEIDGTKSYWALAHAPGPPDFHNRDCFIATLPAPTAP